MLALAAAIALASANAFAVKRVTDEFESGATRPLSIALLPVEAALVRAKVIDTENLIDESLTYGTLYGESAKATMEAKGYTVHVIDAARINADPELQRYVVDANRRFDEMMGHVKPNRIKRRVYNAGDEVRVLADYLGVDAIAFSNFNMTITPAGKAIVAGLIGGTTSGTYSSIALVDGRTGDLEALFSSMHATMPGDKSDEEIREIVATVAERAADELPQADPTARAQASGEEEAFLSDVESLLAK